MFVPLTVLYPSAVLIHQCSVRARLHGSVSKLHVSDFSQRWLKTNVTNIWLHSAKVIFFSFANLHSKIDFIFISWRTWKYIPTVIHSFQTETKPVSIQCTMRISTGQVVGGAMQPHDQSGKCCRRGGLRSHPRHYVQHGECSWWIPSWTFCFWHEGWSGRWTAGSDCSTARTRHLRTEHTQPLHRGRVILANHHLQVTARSGRHHFCTIRWFLLSTDTLCKKQQVRNAKKMSRFLQKVFFPKMFDIYFHKYYH